MKEKMEIHAWELRNERAKREKQYSKIEIEDDGKIIRKQKQKQDKKSIKAIKKILEKKIQSKPVIKSEKATLVIKQVEQEQYKPIYFKETYEQEKRNMFFK